MPSISDGFVSASGRNFDCLAFTLPSLVIVMVLLALYVEFGGISWMRGAFYGIGAAVIAIIARSAVKLVKTTLKHDRLLGPSSPSAPFSPRGRNRNSYGCSSALGLSLYW